MKHIILLLTMIFSLNSYANDNCDVHDYTEDGITYVYINGKCVIQISQELLVAKLKIHSLKGYFCGLYADNEACK